MKTMDILPDDQRMRREIAAFLDADLIAEMKRRGLLKTMAISSEASEEASSLEGFLDHVERRMAADMGRALAEHRAISMTSKPSRYGITLRMHLTVLSPTGRETSGEET